MLLSVEKVVKKFPINRGIFGRPVSFVTALNGVSFNLDRGQILGVVGESGCGKSTLARCVVGLYRPSEGSILWEDVDLGKKDLAQMRSDQRHYQMVFQNPYASLDPRQKVKDILTESLVVHGLWRPSERISYALELLEKVGLSPADLDKFPHEFSGGQRQRIGIARALIGQPKLIVLDEPVSSLDVSVQASILNMLADVNRKQQITYLFISHDLQVIAYLSDRVLVMYLGKVVEEGPTSQVLKKPRHPYTGILLAASNGEKVMVQGEPPSPVHLPSGCPFHTRCPYAEKRCFEETQELTRVEGDWKVACWKWGLI